MGLFHELVAPAAAMESSHPGGQRLQASSGAGRVDLVGHDDAGRAASSSAYRANSFLMIS